MQNATPQRWLCVLTTWVPFVFCESGVLAQTRGVEPRPKPTVACLKWSVPRQSGCSTTQELTAAVEAVLDRRVFVADGCELSVEGSMERSAKGGWLASLSFADRSGRTLGTRQLEGVTPSCATLRGPTSLVIALMVETTESTVAVTESTPAVPVVVTPPTPPKASPAEQGRAYADVRAAYGLLPGMSVGASLGVDATLSGVLPGRFEAALWLPRSTGPGPGGRFWAWHTGVALCPNLNTSARLRVALCGGAQLGLIHATGLNLSETESIHRTYGHVETRMVLALPLASSIAVSAHLTLALPFLRPRFVYWDDVDASHHVHQPNRVLLMGGLGLSWTGATP